MTLSTAPFESRMRISPRRKQTWPFAISNIVDHAKFYSRSHDAVIRVFDEAGSVIESDEHKGDKTLYHIYFFAEILGQRLCAEIAADVLQSVAPNFTGIDLKYPTASFGENFALPFP